MEVDPSDYMPKAVEYCQFRSMFLVTVRETGQTWTGEDDFTLTKPRLTVRLVSERFRVKTQVTVLASSIPRQYRRTRDIFTCKTCHRQ